MTKTQRIIHLIAVLTIMMTAMSCQESIGERFEREASEFTKRNCPRAEFQDIIYLDSLVYHNDGTNDYKYCYSVKADSIMLAEIVNQSDELKARLLQGIRNSVDLRHVKEAGLNIIYAYYNAENDELITEFRFGTEDYR